MGLILIKGCHPKGFPAIFLHEKSPEILMPFEASLQDSEDHVLGSLDALMRLVGVFCYVFFIIFYV